MSGPVLVGRWQDVLPGTYDPATAIVVTDPPYGLAAPGGGLRAPGSHGGIGHPSKQTARALDKGFPDTIPWSQHVAEVLALLPARRHVIRGPATALIWRDYPQPRRLCVEVAAYRRRSAHRPGLVPYLWQGWVVYGRLKIDRHVQAPSGDAFASRTMLQLQPGNEGRRSAHRALTPFPAALWIVENWVDPGCTVIDPFAGLGTIGLAARELGFGYLGAEVDPTYAAIANEKFETERLQLGLPA